MALSLSENAMKYVLEHVSEGAMLAVAMVWIEGARVCVVLVLRREVELIESKRILAVDLNVIHGGIAWVVVERDRALKRGVLRQNISSSSLFALLELILKKKGFINC